MKKFLLSAALVLAGCVSMSAQNIFNNPANEAYFGLRAGFDLSCPGKITSEGVGVDMFKNGAGFEVGGIYNIPVVANFYVEPGLKLFYDTYSVKDDWNIYDGFGIDGISIRKFGMRIPVMAGYRFDFTRDISVSVFTGPELEVGFVGKEHAKSGNRSSSESVYGDDGFLKRTNLLWDFGAGVSYRNYYFSVSGGIGMLNMYNGSHGKFHENRVTFSLGYNF